MTHRNTYTHDGALAESRLRVELPAGIWRGHLIDLVPACPPFAPTEPIEWALPGGRRATEAQLRRRGLVVVRVP